MKRKIVFAQKPGTFAIRGVATIQQHALFTGMPCPGTQGGGFIGDMELVGNSISVRKVDGDGQPVREWGTCPLTTRNGLQTTQIEGDGMLIPMSALEAVVFVDVPEQPKVPKQVEAGDMKLASMAKKRGITVEELEKEYADREQSDAEAKASQPKGK